MRARASLCRLSSDPETLFQAPSLRREPHTPRHRRRAQRHEHALSAAALHSLRPLPTPPLPLGKLKVCLEEPVSLTQVPELPFPPLATPNAMSSSFIYSRLSGPWAPEDKESGPLHAR